MISLKLTNARSYLTMLKSPNEQIIVLLFKSQIHIQISLK